MGARVVVTVDALLEPIDRARTAVFQAFSPLSGRLAGDRDLRVALVGTAGVAVTFALTLAAPLWLLALSPLVFGVPHLVADVRYLVVQPQHHRRRALVVAVVPGLVVASFGGYVPGALVAGAGLSVAGALVAARASVARKIVGLLVAGPLAVIGVLTGAPAQLGLAHAHNGVGVGLWWQWRARDRVALVPIALMLAGGVAIAAGAVDHAALDTFPGGLGAPHHLARLAPEMPEKWGVRLLLLFAYGQSLHYLAWLRLVPEDARTRVTPRSFRASWRALVRDFGAGPLALVAAGATGLAVWGAHDLAAANDGYLRFAAFHGPLELAAVALAAAEGRRA